MASVEELEHLAGCGNQSDPSLLLTIKLSKSILIMGASLASATGNKPGSSKGLDNGGEGVRERVTGEALFM